MAPVVVAAVCGVIASTPVALLVLQPAIDQPWPTVALNWALPNVAGILLILPIIQDLRDRSHLVAGPAHRGVEVLANLGVTAAVVWVCFWAVTGEPVAYSVIGPLVWTAMRFGPLWVDLSVLSMGVAVAWATQNGDGAFAGQPQTLGGLLLAQGFLALVSVATRMLAASSEATDRATTALRTQSADLADAYRRLKAREDLLSTVADSFPGPVGVWDRDGRCLVGNRHYLEWFGRTCAELPGLHIREVLGPEVYARNLPVIDGALRGERQEFERTLAKPTGESGHVLTCYVPLFEEGRPSGFVAAVTDITAVKQAQFRLEGAVANLAREKRRLEAARAMFQRLFDHSPGAVLLLDEAAVAVNANEASSSLWGESGEHLIGTRYDELVSAKERDAVTDPANATANRRLGGPGVPVDVRFGTLLDETTPLTVVTLRDVSHAVASTMELARSNAELQQFAYAASHDLQEPARKIASYVEILEDEYGDQLDDQARQYMRFAVDGARRMRTLIRESEVAVEIGPLPVVAGDAAQLRQVFHNLISNAIKYRGAQAPRVEICADRRDLFWHVRIRDNGIGFNRSMPKRSSARSRGW